MTTNMIEQLLKRDRTIILAGLVAVVGLAWVYTLHIMQAMSNMGMMDGMDMMGMAMDSAATMASSAQAGTAMSAQMIAMPNLHIWAIGDFLLVFVMWAVMMVGMMTLSDRSTCLLWYSGA